MYTELEKRFPVKNISRLNGNPTDILTGTFGASAIVAVYGIPIRYEAEQWPTSEHQYLSEEEHGQLKCNRNHYPGKRSSGYRNQKS